MTTKSNPTPLSGIRVADFTQALAGPQATMTLADLGAEVIKVEPPNGDPMRMEPSGFFSANRNKRSVVIDLGTPEGRVTARELIRTVDVVVHSQRPGMMDAIGLGAAQLRREQPQLIYASLSGYGPAGGTRRSVDAVIQAQSGLMAFQGFSEVALIDVCTGMALVQGVLAAIVERERFGVGSEISANLLDTALFAQAQFLGQCAGGQPNPSHFGDRYPGHGEFQTADKPVCLGVYTNSQWHGFCTAIGAPELLSDPRNQTVASRSARQLELRAELQALLLQRPRAEWLKIWAEHNIIGGPLNTYAETLADAQVRANGAVEDTVDANGNPAIVVRIPFRDVDRDPTPFTAAPALGEHTTEVLAQLSVSGKP